MNQYIVQNVRIIGTSVNNLFMYLGIQLASLDMNYYSYQ